MPEQPCEHSQSRGGQIDDRETDEAPGRIIHEYRPTAPIWLVEQGWPIRNGGIRYYGTSDATSWFLILLAATKDSQLQAELSDAREAAARWLQHALAQGSGFVRCGPRLHAGGLSQQGWRDSLDPATDDQGGGIVREDGSPPEAPLADVDSQAAAVAALQALTVLDPSGTDHWHDALNALRHKIGDSFDPDVMAIDANGSSVSGAGSQLGWLLWSGALDESAAMAAAERLIQPDILTPFGLRTLSMAHPAFLVDGYPQWAVWPFDNWTGWGGLRVHGYADAADRVRSGVFAALEHLGRFPELYAVTGQGALAGIPVANRIQAWTVGAVSAFNAGWDAASDRSQSAQ